MEKTCLRQLEAPIIIFNFYRKRFLKKPLYKARWPKIRFFSHPLLDKKVNLRRKNYYLVYIEGFPPRMSHI